MLIQANQLKQSGKFEEAANIFERLARGAEQRGILARAPHLYLEAAYCRLHAKQIQPGIDLMWQGFRLLEKTKRWRAIYMNGRKAIAELQPLEQPEAAEKLQTWLDQTLKEHPEATSSPTELTTSKKPLRFPPKCPQCGASIHMNQVDWIDEVSIECPYCGSAIQPEQ
jgi:predicted RNA-binding Zn-ribbon protein involved in translation (DUF1610 family)